MNRERESGGKGKRGLVVVGVTLFVIGLSIAALVWIGTAPSSQRISTNRLELAWRLVGEGRMSKAKAIYLEEYKKNERDPGALRGLAIVARESGDDEMAIAYWERLSQVTSGEEAAFVWKQIGLAQRRLGRDLEALTSLQTAMSLLPSGTADAELAGLVAELATEGSGPSRRRPIPVASLRPTPPDPHSRTPQPPDPTQHLPRKAP